MINIIKKYKILCDIILNIVATALPLLTLQIVVLPLMATTLSEDKYGYLLSITSLITIVSVTLGNSLNNIRLLEQYNYSSKGYCGDFNIILLIEVIGNIFFVLIGLRFLGKPLTPVEIFLIVLYSVFTIMREYYIVNYRIKLNYIAIVWNNIALIGGYIIGYFIYTIFNIWIAPYLVGTLFGLMHVLYKNELIYEPLLRTKLFKSSAYKTIILCMAGILSNALAYSDRLLIYPILGGKSVAIYFAASFLGKIISTAIGPVISVILSYLSKANTVPLKKIYFSLALSVVTAIIGYILGIAISQPILSILYPFWAQEATKYIKLTTATAMIIMCTSILKPFVLRYCNINWQITTSLIPFIVYLILTVLLYPTMGLYGFCASILISNLLKYFILLGAFFKEISRRMDEK